MKGNVEFLLICLDVMKTKKIRLINGCLMSSLLETKNKLIITHINVTVCTTEPESLFVPKLY